MSEDPWFRCFPTNWIAGVSQLSAAERGVYATLVMQIYDTGASLKFEEARLARLCGASVRNFRRAFDVLVEHKKLILDHGEVKNLRAEVELQERAELRLRRVRGANLTNEKKRYKSTEHSTLSDSVSATPSERSASRPAHASRARVLQLQPHIDPNGSIISETPAVILETCLSPQTAKELIDHRKALKKPMTAGAARALAKQFVEFGAPEEAAQAMMAHGWQGFKPEWLASDARAGPAGRSNGMMGFRANVQKMMDAEAAKHERTNKGNGSAGETILAFPAKRE